MKGTLMSVSKISSPLYVVQEGARKFTVRDSKQEILGTFLKSLISLRAHYQCKDTKSSFCSQGTAKILSLGQDIDVQDEKGNRLGSLIQKIVRFYKEYHLFNGAKEKIAVAKEEPRTWKFWTKEAGLFRMKVWSPDRKEELAEVSKSLENEAGKGDVWTIQVKKEESIDPRFLALLAIFETDVEKPLISLF